MPVHVSTEREAALTNEISSAHGASLIVTDICYKDKLKDLDGLKKYHRCSLKHFT
jgi:hypothetical protein